MGQRRGLVEPLLVRRGRLRGSELTWLRQQAGISQKRMALLMGLRAEHLSRAEHGKARLSRSAEKLWRYVVAAYAAPKIAERVLFMESWA